MHQVTHQLLLVVYLNLGSCVVRTPTSSSEGLKSMDRTVDRQEIAVWEKEEHDDQIVFVAFLIFREATQQETTRQVTFTFVSSLLLT